MPKVPASSAHFDVPGLLAAVAAQDVGIRVTTNNPRGFRRILYQAIRQNLGPRCYIYQSARSPKGFLLLRERFGEREPLAEETADAD